MVSDRVQLGENIDSSRLEKILIKAGEKMKWNYNQKDYYFTEYNLNPIREEEKLDYVKLYFWGGPPKIDIKFGSNDTFITIEKPNLGHASKDEIKKFLGYVSCYITKKKGL